MKWFKTSVANSWLRCLGFNWDTVQQSCIYLNIQQRRKKIWGTVGDKVILKVCQKRGCDESFVWGWCYKKREGQLDHYSHKDLSACRHFLYIPCVMCKNVLAWGWCKRVSTQKKPVLGGRGSQTICLMAPFRFLGQEQGEIREKCDNISSAEQKNYGKKCNLKAN